MGSFAELVGCRLPIQLAGLGGVGADAALPIAVSEAGALGMIGAAAIPVEALADMLDEIARRTSRPIGVNFLIPFLDPAAVEVAAKKSPVVEFMFGDPDASLVDRVHEHDALAGWQVGSADEASAAFAARCDYVVVQGHEAGGHVRGAEPLRRLLSAVAASASIPVIAAGGIATGKDVAAALHAGASAVRIGTRFLAATESIAHPDYVDAVIGARASDTVLTRAFSREWDAPHRVIRSAIDAATASPTDTVATLVSPRGEWPIPRFSTLTPTTHARGNIAAMAMYAGTSVDGVHERKPAAEIVDELTAQI